MKFDGIPWDPTNFRSDLIGFRSDLTIGLMDLGSDIDFYNGNKFSKIIAHSIFQLPIAAHLSKYFGWRIAHYSKIPRYATDPKYGKYLDFFDFSSVFLCCI